MKKINYLFWISVFMLTFARGQINTYSPYSYFGPGEVHPIANTNNISMGGGGVSYISNSNINHLNPASYSFLDQTSFEFAIKTTFINMSQNNLNQNNFVSGLSNIGIGFPISNNIGFAMGLLPYSSVGYNVTNSAILSNHEDEIETNSEYMGSGGLNQFKFGLSWKIKSHFSAGLGLNYLFGLIDRETIIYTDQSSLYFRDKVNNTMKGLVPEIGVLYGHFIDDYKFNFGLKIKSKKKLFSNLHTLESTYSGPVYSSETEYVISEEEIFDTSVTLPLECSFGLSVEFDNKWLVGLDYNYVNWSNYSENNEPISYMTNKNEFILGGEFVPEENDIYNYFKRVKYRFGLLYASGHLDFSTIDNTVPKLKEIAITAGVGLPINKVTSTANLGFKWSLRGYNLSENFIQEEYLSMYLSMTLNEKWFKKRKIE